MELSNYEFDSWDQETKDWFKSVIEVTGNLNDFTLNGKDLITGQERRSYSGCEGLAARGTLGHIGIGALAAAGQAQTRAYEYELRHYQLQQQAAARQSDILNNIFHPEGCRDPYED